jgi:hypothetical protein
MDENEALSGDVAVLALFVMTALSETIQTQQTIIDALRTELGAERFDAAMATQREKRGEIILHASSRLRAAAQRVAPIASAIAPESELLEKTMELVQTMAAQLQN